MKSIQRLFWSMLLVVSLALVACGGGEEAEVVEPTLAATQAPEENEPEPTATSEPEPTDTSEPEPTATSEPEPTATAEPEPTAPVVSTSDLAEFDNDALGISLMYPADWVTEIDEVALEAQFASNQGIIDDPGAIDGAGFNIIRVDSEFLSFFGEDVDVEDPVSVLDTFIQLITEQEDEEIAVVSEPTATTIAGEEAASVNIEAKGEDVTGHGVFYAVLSEGQVTFILSIVSENSRDELQPVLDAMLDSLSLRPGEGGVATTVDTPTDLPESQGILLYGDTVNGTLAADETVVWDFIGFEGEVFDLTVEPGENLDVIVNVLDADGNSILEGEVDDSFGVEEVKGVTVAATGDYYVVLTGFGGSSGDYALTVTEAGASSSSGETFASSGSLVYGERVQSSVVAGDTAKWSFAAVAGDVLNIVITPLDDDLDVVVDVVDAAGNSILPSGEVDESFDAEEIVGQVITADGNYIIVVRGFADATGNFELSLDNGAGGNIPTGDTLAYGEASVGSITDDETVTYTFFGNENDLVDVTVDPLTEEFDVIFDVLDDDGRSILEDGEIDVSFDTEFLRVQRLPQSGAFTIAVHGYDGSTGDFEVSVDLTNGGDYATVLYTFYAIEEADETHSFPFYTLSGDQVTILAQPVGNEFDVVISIYDDDGDEVLESVDNTTGFEELVFVAPNDGNYYFEVSGFEGSLGDYDVTLIGPATTEFVLAAGDVIDGHFTEDNSLINYWYDGAAGETIDLVLEGDADSDVKIRILDSDGNLLTEIDEGLDGESEELSYTFEDETSIIIEVSEFFGRSGFFTFTVDSDQ